MANVVKTQGSHLFFLNPGETPAVVEVSVKQVSGISAGRSQIEITDLAETTAKKFVSGLAEPGQATFELQFDPSSTNHTTLHGHYKAGTVLKFALGWSDGTAEPTITADALTTPTTRTWLKFEAYIIDMSFDFSGNNVVTASCSLQVSGFPDITLKA